MQTVAYTDIDHAEESDIGKIALMSADGCGVLAIEDTLDACIATAERCTGETISSDDIDTRTDLHYLTNDDLVAVEVGESE